MSERSERFEPVSIENARAIKATSMAILVEVDDEEYWIPISQIDDDSEVYQKGDEGTLIIPRWLAEEKGLI
jgi:hypothetical protein